MVRMKKIIASALIFILMTSLLPANVLAAGTDSDTAAASTDITATTVSTAKIVGEITEKREKNVKYLFKDDQSFEADVYNTAVHYQDSNGQWKDIDNTLVDAKDENGNDVLKNKENDFSVEVSKNANSGKLVSLKKDDYELSWNIEKTQPDGTASEGQLDAATIQESSDTTASIPAEGNSSSDAAPEEISTSVSAVVAQADEAKLQEKIDKIASDKAENTMGYDKLSEEKRAELKQISKENEEKKTLRKVTSSVEFNQILKDTSIVYTLQGDTVKEDIVLSKAPENPVYKFNINTKNLIPKIDSNNNIVFYDQSDASKEVYIMQAPYMYDSNKESSSNIDVSIEKGSDGYVLMVKPDAKWLNESKRAYPVTIDPTVSTSVDINSVEDSSVSSAQPNTNYYNNMYLKTGYGSITGTDRTFIKFDNLPQIGASDMIISAWLDLACNTTQGSQVNVHEVQGNWNSRSITWNNMPSYNNIIEDYQSVTSGGNYYYWDITNIVEQWYSGQENYGLMLKANNESAGYTEFFSSDISDQYSYARPQAQICYIDNAGLESYWTYHSASAGRAGTGYISDSTGNLVFIHNDLSMNGSRMPVSVNHVYNSADAKAWDWSRQWMGAGWSMNVTQRVYWQTIGGTNYWIYVDEDGTKKYFLDNGTNELKDELNLGYTFIKEPTGHYSVKDKSDNKAKFNWNGMLNSFIDNNGNTITADYGNAPGTGVQILTKLTDGVGRETTFCYDNNGILLYINDPSDRKTWFSYDTQSYQKLTQITYPDEKTTTFNYDSNYKLISATNIDGTKISYEYYNYAPYRVKKVLESNGIDLGDELNFSYGNNQTTLTDCKGRKNIYQFNNAGNTTCVMDSDWNASYYNYSDGSNISKCTLESKLQKTQVNPLLNHNMESESYWTKGNWSGGTVTQECTTEDKYMGNSSIKLAKTTASGGCDFEQNGIQLEKGGKYTLSAYVKTIDVPGSSNSGAAIFIGYIDSNNVTQFEKRYFNGTSDWHREEMQFALPANAQSNTVWIGCGLLDTTGTAYFDCVQLESGSIANRYNIIENPDFSNGSAFWTKNGQCDGSDAVIGNSEGHPTTFEASAFKFNGQTDKQKNLLQMVNVNGKAGDSFVVGAWAKGDSAPLYYPRNFGISVGFKRASGDYDWHEIKFNNDSRDWQYLSNKVVANSDYTQVACYLIYYNNVNSVMFDGIQLYKEEFGDSYTYDSKGNVVSTADLANQNSSFAYNGSNDLVKSVDPKGSEFNYVYDDKHNIEKATSAENVVYSFEYDNYGNPLTSTIGDSTTLSLNSSATYTSDTPDNKAEGNYLSTMTDSSGNTITNNWDTDKGLLESVKTSNETDDQATKYAYDSNTDNLTSVSKLVDNNVILNEYAYKNDRIKSISHNGFDYNFEYDNLGNTEEVKVGNVNLIQNTFESRSGNLKQSIYGNSIPNVSEQIVSYVYDNLDRITSKKYNGIERFTYQYDGSGNLGYKEDKVNGVNYRYIYDLAGRFVKTQDSNGNSTTYNYESTNITQIKLWHYYGDGRQYHDILVQLSNDPTFKTGVTTVYNNDTNNSSGLGAGTDTEYSETSSGKIISINSIKARYVRLYSNGSSVNTCNHYVEAEVDDASGNNMAAGKSLTSSVTFSNQGYITDGNSNTNNYSDSYPNTGLQWIQIDLGTPSNLSNNVASLSETLAGQSDPIITRYEYDKDTKPTKVTLNNGSCLTNSYDTQLGRLNKKTINTGSISYDTNYSYLQGASGSTSTTTKVGSITNNGNAISYTYDRNGNISTITQGDNDINYQYNELNEIIRENNEVLEKTITYSYDAGGNIISKTEYGYTEQTPDVPLKTITYDYDDIWKDLLESYTEKKPGEQDKVYTVGTDSIGNTTEYKGWEYAWEEGRQLSKISFNTIDRVNFMYDDSGIRTQKSVKVGQNTVTTNYHLVGDKVTYQENVTNGTEITDKIYYTYDSSGNLVSMNLNGTAEYYYIKNAQGDIIGLFDSTGTQVVSYTYDTWGKLISIKDGSGNVVTNDTTNVGYKNPYRYREYRYDSETQLYYLQSRYYNPEWGRFINADAVGGKIGTLLSHNMFAYCMNNPVNMVDPDGFTLESAFLAIVAGVVTTAAAIATAATAVTVGPAIMVGVAIVVGIGMITVGAVQLGTKVFGHYSDEEMDKVNIKDNVCKAALGKETGEKVSAAIDVGMVALPTGSGALKAARNPEATLKALKVASGNLPKMMKDPMTYFEALDKYNSSGSLIKGLHTLHMIDDDTYNKVIPIF